jgi:hypothetical protein
MIGLAFLTEDLARQLRGVAVFDDEDERRGRRVGGGAGGSGQQGRFRRGGGQMQARSSPTRVTSAAVRSGSVSGGAQSAVVKIASFAAGGKRVGALTDYLSRDGSLAVETQTGARLLGREAIAAEVAEWTSLFAGRAPSKDVASLRIAGLAGTDESVTGRLAQAFQGRRFAWQRDEDDQSLRVVVVLAAKDRRRLDVSAAGRRAIEARFERAGPWRVFGEDRRTGGDERGGQHQMSHQPPGATGAKAPAGGKGCGCN